MDLKFPVDKAPQINFHLLVEIRAHQLAFADFFIEKHCKETGKDAEALKLHFLNQVNVWREEIQEDLYKEYGLIDLDSELPNEGKGY